MNILFRQPSMFPSDAPLSSTAFASLLFLHLIPIKHAATARAATITKTMAYARKFIPNNAPALIVRSLFLFYIDMYSVPPVPLYRQVQKTLFQLINIQNRRDVCFCGLPYGFFLCFLFLNSFYLHSSYGISYSSFSFSAFPFLFITR